MATVEELRGKVFKIVDYSWQHTGLEETLDSLIAAAEARGVAKLLANLISRGTLYVNMGGIGDLPDGQYSVITILAPDTKELTEDEKIARLAEIVQQTEEPEVTIITRAGSAPKEEK